MLVTIDKILCLCQSISDSFRPNERPKLGSQAMLATNDFSEAIDSVRPSLFKKLVTTGVPLLALFNKLNRFFPTGVLAWFSKIQQVAPFKSAVVFRKDPFLAPVLFSLFTSC